MALFAGFRDLFAQRLLKRLVLRLGQAYLESARLPRAVQPYLQRVTAGTGEVA